MPNFSIGEQHEHPQASSVLLFSVVLIFRHPHSAYYDAVEEFVYSAGNAPQDVSAEITEQLDKFQEGYTQRDMDQVGPFMPLFLTAILLTIWLTVSLVTLAVSIVKSLKNGDKMAKKIMPGNLLPPKGRYWTAFQVV